jgi:hypothetical protein
MAIRMLVLAAGLSLSYAATPTPTPTPTPTLRVPPPPPLATPTPQQLEWQDYEMGALHTVRLPQPPCRHLPDTSHALVCLPACLPARLPRTRCSAFPVGGCLTAQARSFSLTSANTAS